MTDDAANSDDEDLAALREQTTHGDRLDEAATGGVSDAFVETLVAELEAVETGERQKTVSVWDGSLAAFLAALDSHPEQMEAVGAELQATLDASEREIDRSEIIRLAIRVGLSEAAPEAFSALQTGVQRHAVNQL